MASTTGNRTLSPCRTSEPARSLLLLLALLLFGAKRLPEIGRSLGTGMKEFKDSVTGNEAPRPARAAASTSTETTTTSPREHETV